MRKWLTGILVALACTLGVGWAQGIFTPATDVDFEDTGFDYFAEDYGYLHLTREGDTVRVILNNIAEGGIRMEYDDIVDPAENAEDADEAEYRQATLQSMAGIDVGTRGVDLTFKDANLDEVMTYFKDTITDLNFTPVQVVSSANTLAFDCGCNADTGFHLRAVFTRIGEDVFVHLSAT